MADTVADVLVRLGVDTAGMRAGFRDARSQTAQFASDLARTLAGSGRLVSLLGGGAGGPLLAPLTRSSGNAGGLLSSFASLFTGLFNRAARNIAQEIRASFQEISRAYAEGSATLGATIQQLEQQRAAAIQRLSGRKGGRRQLDQLLPQVDQTLAELRARQQIIFERFDASLDALRVGEAFRGVAADVRELLGEYRNYVDAGGDLARANEFLSRSLEQLRGQALQQLASGEESAIEDALRLNGLLQERADLLADSADQERRILTRGVLERQHTFAQDQSAEIEAVRRQRDEQLAALDQEIQVQQLKVDSEARVFHLASDRVALETRLLELKAVEFDREATQLAALQDVVAGIVPNAAGLISLSPTLRQELNLGGVQIIVGEGATSAQAQAAGENAIEGMLRALSRERARFGLAN